MSRVTDSGTQVRCVTTASTHLNHTINAAASLDTMRARDRRLRASRDGAGQGRRDYGRVKRVRQGCGASNLTDS